MSLPDPASSGDTGKADEALVKALSVYSAGAGVGAEPALAAVCRSRLLVPLVVLNGDTQGEADDGSPSVAAVLLQGADGRKALLSFSGLDSMHRWDATARPVPVSARDAARSALQEGADALVVDLAGPATFVVESAALGHVAAGHVFAETTAGYVWLARG